MHDGLLTQSCIVHQLRVVVEADDYDAAFTFYRDVLGMPGLDALEADGQARRRIRMALVLGGPTSGARRPAQQSNTDQQMSLRRRWSSSTRSRTASGSWSCCHRHSRRPAGSTWPAAAAARAALIA